MSQQDTFGLEVSRGFVAKLVLAAVGFAGSVVFARYLGPAAYGAFHVVVAAANILDNPMTGFGDACKKRISEHGVDRGEVVGAGLLVAVGGALLISVPVAVVGPLVNSSEISNFYYFIGVVLFSITLFKILQPMIDGVGEFGTSVMLDSLRSILTIPLQLVLIFLGWGVAGMVYGLSVASLLTVPVGLYVLGVRPSRPTVETAKSLWSFARFSIPKNFVGAAYSRIDILLLAAILGSGASGQYQIAYQLVLPGAFVATVMGSGLFTEISTRASHGDGASQQITNNIAFASVFAIPLFFGALAMPEDIVVTTFGSEYRSAAPLLIGLGVYQIVSTQTGQLSAVLLGYDRPDLSLKITVASLVVNLSFGVLLVYRIGAVGVVVATVLTEIIKYLLLQLYLRRRATYERFPRLLQYQFLAGAVMFLVVNSAHSWWGVESVIDLLALVGLGGLVYGVALVFLSDIVFATARTILHDARDRYLGD